MPCLEAPPEKTNLSLSKDDFMGSFKTVECKGSWKTDRHFSNALLRGFHCASYHHTNSCVKACLMPSSPRTSNSSLNQRLESHQCQDCHSCGEGKRLENTSSKTGVSHLKSSGLIIISDCKNLSQEKGSTA